MVVVVTVAMGGAGKGEGKWELLQPPHHTRYRILLLLRPSIRYSKANDVYTSIEKEHGCTTSIETFALAGEEANTLRACPGDLAGVDLGPCVCLQYCTAGGACWPAGCLLLLSARTTSARALEGRSQKKTSSDNRKLYFIRALSALRLNFFFDPVFYDHDKVDIVFCCQFFFFSPTYHSRHIFFFFPTKDVFFHHQRRHRHLGRRSPGD